MKEKLKNYGLWMSVSALLLMIGQDAGLEITTEKYELYVNSFLTILILLGIVSDPKSGQFYSDKKKDDEGKE